MSRIVQPTATRGSQYWLQQAVNNYPRSLDEQLRSPMQLAAGDSITWLSPMALDDFAEYRDETFLERTSLRLRKRQLQSFWPSGGPVWDGLATTTRNDVILVEAKAHISELVSSCQAAKTSRHRIRNSLNETAAYFGAKLTDSWTQRYYQYANRLAFLYLLRCLNHFPTWLVFVYFVGDLEMNGPNSILQWQSAIETVHARLGIRSEQLKPYVLDVFIDVQNLTSA